MLEQFVLEHRKTILQFFAVLLSFVLLLGPFTLLRWQKVTAQVNQNVDVSGTIEAWLVFTVSPTSTTLTPAMVQADGTANIASSTQISLSVGTNNPSGWDVTIRGTNHGLLRSGTPQYRIPTVTGTSTLSAGTDGYGANATSTLSGVAVGSLYDFWNTFTVGEISSSTANNLLGKGNENSTQEVGRLKIYSAANTADPPGTYQDTVILTAATRP